MTLLHTQGRSSGERHAIKAWLEEHGAGSGPQIDTAKLEGTGINGAALTHAAEKGPIDLLVLKGATQEGQRPDLDEKQRVAGAKLALKNATKLSVSVTDQLLSLTGKGIPSKDALSKLSAKSKALYQETFRWSQGDKYLAWLKPDHVLIRGDRSRIVLQTKVCLCGERRSASISLSIRYRAQYFQGSLCIAKA